MARGSADALVGIRYEAQSTQDCTVITPLATKGTTEYPVTDHAAVPVGFEAIMTA